MADRFGVSGARALLTDVRAALDAWSEYTQSAGLPISELNRVAADFTPL